MTSTELVQHIIDAADDIKADRIESLDVKNKTSIADFLVICTGTSDRHVESIADKVEEKLRILKERPLRTEGSKSGWILQDYGDVIFHVMREEQRQFFDLESFWQNMKPNPDII